MLIEIPVVLASWFQEVSIRQLRLAAVDIGHAEFFSESGGDQDLARPFHKLRVADQGRRHLPGNSGLSLFSKSNALPCATLITASVRTSPG
jgi:hypothetical protein